MLREPPLDRDAELSLAEVTLRPVVPRPGKIICVGLNYHAHVAETKRDLPEYPVLFTKFATSLTGPYDPVPCPPESEAIDYEGELAVVIGRRARRVSRERALDVVAGYTVANDVTMRDYQYKTHQWLQGKAWDRSTPLGPMLVTPDEVGDPGALKLRTTVNGQVVQDASTELLIFDVAHAGQRDLRVRHARGRRRDPDRHSRWGRLPPRAPAAARATATRSWWRSTASAASRTGSWPSRPLASRRRPLAGGGL